MTRCAPVKAICNLEPTPTAPGEIVVVRGVARGVTRPMISYPMISYTPMDSLEVEWGPLRWSGYSTAEIRFPFGSTNPRRLEHGTPIEVVVREIGSGVSASTCARSANAPKAELAAAREELEAARDIVRCTARILNDAPGYSFERGVWIERLRKQIVEYGKRFGT